MPGLTVRKADEVPVPSRVSRAVKAQHDLYDDFIRDVNGNVGELELAQDDVMRAVKVRLRRAATRLNLELEIWDVSGRVYFRRTNQRRRGRPRKTA